jgi:murein DD-endopeptidase MepM/ murein hydrolase activator NlpD
MRKIWVLCVLLLAACGGIGGEGRHGEVPAPRDKPAAPGTTVVQEGETLADVAARSGVTTRDLIDANGLVPPYRVFTGQLLKVPQGETKQKLGVAPQPKASAPQSALRFNWPVHSGEVISRFGNKLGSARNDGINIAAREGSPIVAAADGVVAYAGDELKGFGNLILIRHANGWISAYAHNQALLVAKGDSVRRAQPIARLGHTGNVDRPQLHFELRHETEAVDPLGYLPATGNHPRLGPES